ncbi:MAG: hypothetical protein ABI114_16900 [Rhodanobacter sp.]
MNAPARQIISAAHRARVLRALGVTPWVRRSAQDFAVVDAQAVAALNAGPVLGDCVVVLPAGCSTRELDFLGRALNAYGTLLARAARVTLQHGELAHVPEVRAYLAFGEAQAQALGRALPATALQQAQIILADELAATLTDAGAKRRLWSALRSLRRALAAVGR